MSFGIFEHDAAFSEGERIAARQAVAVARKNAADQFGAFLASATGDDYHARLALIDSDLRQVVQAAVDEYGGEYERVEAAVRESLNKAGGNTDHLKEFQFKPKGETDDSTDDDDKTDDDKTDDDKTDDDKTDDDTDINSELDDAPSAVTSRWQVTADMWSDLGGLGKGFVNDVANPVGNAMGQAAHDTVNYVSPIDLPDRPGQQTQQTQPTAPGAQAPGAAPDFNAIHDTFSQIGGNASNGVQNQYNPGAHTQQNYDQVAKQMGLSADQVQQGLQQYYQNSSDPKTQQMAQQFAQPMPQGGAPLSQQPPQQPPQSQAPTGVDNRDPQAVNKGLLQPVATRTADSTTGLSTTPSPKMDKKKWNGLDPIKTEDSNSRSPTVQQDVSDVADHAKDFLDQTDAVTKSEDVGKEVDIDAIHTDTWSGTDGQANPVTSAAHDPDRNPLRTLMEQGFLPPNQVTAAIQAFEQN